MGQINPARGSPDDENLVDRQREANESLLLAGLRAHEEADQALEDRIRAEEETSALRTRESDLRATAELRERLIGIIGHDLCSPLNTIVMAGGMLVAHGALSPTDARLADRIVHSGRRMARMISQLVEFTRARLGGGFLLNPVTADLGEICRNIAEELRIGTLTQVHQTTEGDLVGRWDEDHLAEAISNIAGNAIDHAASSTAVLIHSRGDKDWVVTEITNHGTCIPAELLPEIFSAFRRVPAKASARSAHLGLGLYIAYEVARTHGGTIEVRSDNGSTTFTLSLPRRPPSLEPAA